MLFCSKGKLRDSEKLGSRHLIVGASGIKSVVWPIGFTCPLPQHYSLTTEILICIACHFTCFDGKNCIKISPTMQNVMLSIFHLIDQTSKMPRKTKNYEIVP